eukprot:8005350-Alexandrium_andersonii.AAC.1
MSVAAHGAVLASHRSRLTSLGAWAKVRNVSRHFQCNHLTIGQDKVRSLSTWPHEGESMFHTPHTNGNDIGSAVKNV